MHCAQPSACHRGNAQQILLFIPLIIFIVITPFPVANQCLTVNTLCKCSHVNNSPPKQEIEWRHGIPLYR